MYSGDYIVLSFKYFLTRPLYLGEVDQSVIHESHSDGFKYLASLLTKFSSIQCVGKMKILKTGNIAWGIMVFHVL